MVDAELIERWTRRLRHETPGAIAVLLGGSFVRGDAGSSSDLDFEVVVAGGPRDEWPTWFDLDGDRMLRIDAWIRDLPAWLASQEEPQGWAFGLPCSEPLRLLWTADESLRVQVDRSGLQHPGGPPELEHFIADLGKMANAHERGDELTTRLAAQDLARSCPALLRPLNPDPRPPVASRRAALLTVLAFEVAPPDYRHDLLVCLGIPERPADAEAVRAAAGRLATGVVELLATRLETIRPLLNERMAASLGDGTLRRYVAQLSGELR